MRGVAECYTYPADANDVLERRTQIDMLLYRELRDRAVQRTRYLAGTTAQASPAQGFTTGTPLPEQGFPI